MRARLELTAVFTGEVDGEFIEHHYELMRDLDLPFTPIKGMFLIVDKKPSLDSVDRLYIDIASNRYPLFRFLEIKAVHYEMEKHSFRLTAHYGRPPDTTEDELVRHMEMFVRDYGFQWVSRPE